MNFLVASVLFFTLQNTFASRLPGLLPVFIEHCAERDVKLCEQVEEAYLTYFAELSFAGLAEKSIGKTATMTALNEHIENVCTQIKTLQWRHLTWRRNGSPFIITTAREYLDLERRFSVAGLLRREPLRLTGIFAKDVALGILRDIENVSRLKDFKESDVSSFSKAVDSLTRCLFNGVTVCSDTMFRVGKAGLVEWGKYLWKFNCTARAKTLEVVEKICANSFVERVLKRERTARFYRSQDRPLSLGHLVTVLQNYEIVDSDIVVPDSYDHLKQILENPTKRKVNIEYTQHKYPLLPFHRSNFSALPLPMMRLPYKVPFANPIIALNWLNFVSSTIQQKLQHLTFKYSQIIRGTRSNQIDFVKTADACKYKISWLCLSAKLNTVQKRILYGSSLACALHAYHCHVLKMAHRCIYDYPQHDSTTGTYRLCPNFRDWIFQGQSGGSFSD